MRRLVIVAVASALLAAAPAQAHIQVSPTRAAPGDAVLFQLLVPNERAASTVEVSMKVPGNVIPFSYEEPAGWKRRITLANNGAPDIVHWRGHVAVDGFARFGFLATTPAKAGPLAWKTIQRYSDGKEVRWIGAPGSDTPAAVTAVKAGVPRQNAGGEGGSASAEAAAIPAAATAATNESAASEDSPLALILGVAGLALGAIALAIALRRSPRR
jgi:uncharacterized protein YcnI